MADAVEKRDTDDDRAWLAGLVTRANGGDPEALAELRRFLEVNPGLARKMGDLSWHVESTLTGLIAGGDALAAEAIRRESDRLREELRGEGATPLESLLVDEVIAAHLLVRHLHLLAAQSPGQTRGQATQLARRLESAQRLHAGAAKSLATIRKLLPAAKPGGRLKVYAAGGQVG
jgi:hypothetical protein